MQIFGRVRCQDMQDTSFFPLWCLFSEHIRARLAVACVCVKTLLTRVSSGGELGLDLERNSRQKSPSPCGCRHLGASYTEDDVRRTRAQPRVSEPHDFHAAAGRGRRRGKTQTSTEWWKLGGHFLPEGLNTRCGKTTIDKCYCNMIN